MVSPTGKVLRHIRMGTTEKFRPVPWGLTVLPLKGSDIVIASIDNEYQVIYEQWLCLENSPRETLRQCPKPEHSAGDVIQGCTR